MKRRKVIPKRYLLDTLKACRGNVFATANHLGISRETIYKRIGLEEIERIRQDADTWRIDVALDRFDESLLSGERWAVEKVLNCKAGWHETTNVNQSVTFVKYIEGVDEDDV